MVFRSSFLSAICSAALLFSGAAYAATEELCSLAPSSYATAKQSHPELSVALDELTKHSVATWYSDRNGDVDTVAERLVSTCPESSRLSVVVYGLPQKDCEAGYSSTNSRVQNAADYVQFLQKLIDTIKDRKVLYVLEPDAVGLLAKEGGCGEAAGYRANLKTAIQMLSQNPNAEIYLDVGYWTLAYEEPRHRVVEVVQNLLSGGGRVKGITLNTSNYRKTGEIAELCTAFQSTMGGASPMNCIIDTSRNYRGSPSTEWCNVGAAGIGPPASAATGFSNIDYFLWIKVPGESDGMCNGGDHTADAMRGPAAGEFFVDGFKTLWNNGFFVDAMHMAAFDGSAPAPAPAPAPTPTPTPDTTSFIQTGAPALPEPETTPAPTTSTPTTWTPEVTTSTPDWTPVTSAPDVTTSTPDWTPVTSAPEVTTSTPITSAPEVTTSTPDWTPITSAPEVTTSAPATTTPSPMVDTTPLPPMPTVMTVAPGTGATDKPSTPSPMVTPTPVDASSSSSGSSTGSPTIGMPTPRPSFRPTTEPKTKAPKTKSPEPTTVDPAEDPAQHATPPATPDGGPQTISNNPSVANTKSSGGSSGTGGVIAAVLVGAVALAVAAAVFIHIRRRAQDATADEMKTPVSMDPAHPAYLSQL